VKHPARQSRGPSAFEGGYSPGRVAVRVKLYAQREEALGFSLRVVSKRRLRDDEKENGEDMS